MFSVTCKEHKGVPAWGGYKCCMQPRKTCAGPLIAEPKRKGGRWQDPPPQRKSVGGPARKLAAKTYLAMVNAERRAKENRRRQWQLRCSVLAVEVAQERCRTRHHVPEFVFCVTCEAVFCKHCFELHLGMYEHEFDGSYLFDSDDEADDVEHDVHQPDDRVLAEAK
jgi:hypothetical protein